MIYLSLLNFAMYQVIGLALLLVWRANRSQTFARHMGWSTLFASLVSIGYVAYTGEVAPLVTPGLVLMGVGAVLNTLFLCYGVVQLAGRELPRGTAIALTALTAAVLLAPLGELQLRYWGLCNLVIFVGLGALATRWLWRTGLRERLVGPLLVLLGLNQLWLVLALEGGLGPQILTATVLRVMISMVFLLSALDRANAATRKLAQRFQRLTEHAVQGVLVTDGARILYANPAARAIYGMPLGDDGYLMLSDVSAATFRHDLLARYHQQLQDQSVDIASWEGLREVGGGRELELRFEAWRVEWDGVPATQVLITDDTERNANARELLHQATHDKLTDLPNRTVLMQRLKDYCQVADGSLRCTLVIVNIDRFKLFNQSQGHVAGDQVLKAFAARLQEALGAGAELMRIAGDEFAIVDPGASHTREIADRLRNACVPALVVPGGDYFIDASMGMAVFPDHAGNAEGLLRAANAAMYQAKRIPGTALAMAEQSFEKTSDKALENEQALRKGIKNHEIYLDYQPKVCAVSGRLLGFEALARWQRPGIGPVSPVEFIAIAERTGLIKELGAMLLERACRQIAAWRAEAGDCVPVAVNVSPIQLLHRGFPQLVERIVAETGIPQRCLTLEITESAAVVNLDDTRSQLKHLCQLGIHIAMDDFGTGFSSLSMLRTLPLSTLKIDRGLIDPLPARDAVEVVTAICQLAKALEMRVVAEGIETIEQAHAARDAGCHELQGYYYARPLSVRDAGAWLAREQTESARHALTAS
nr:EAL domain-containing protein [uncultured Duganella sp.]